MENDDNTQGRVTKIFFRPQHIRETVVGPGTVSKIDLHYTKEILKNTSLAAQGALAHRLQRRTACSVAPPSIPPIPT